MEDQYRKVEFEAPYGIESMALLQELRCLLPVKGRDVLRTEIQIRQDQKGRRPEGFIQGLE